jgi:hypothetical protein
MSKSHNAGKAVAAIAMNIPENPTSGDQLRALCEAYEAGYRAASEAATRSVLSDIPTYRGLRPQAI